MTKDELREYAAANYERLKKQDVALGDVVKILVGPFAGKEGVVRGIYAFDDDFANPCYKVDIVPDKYKCRKKQLTTNNVMGDLSAYEFEVIGNRAPNNEPKRDPDIHVKDGDAEYKVWNGDDNHISVKAVIEADKPKPKFNVGDKVKIVSTNNIALQDKVGIVAERPDGVSSNLVKVEIPNKSFTYLEPCQLAPYTEPTATEDEEKKAEAQGEMKWEEYNMELAAKIAAIAVEAANRIIEQLKMRKV